MADKEILAVQIDDSEFSVFKRKFDEYEAAVKAMPKQWQSASTEISVHRTNFEKIVASAGNIYRSMELATISQSASSRVIEATELAWSGIGKRGKLFRSDIVHATQSLMRWTKLTAVFSGLLGAGGLFGINRMAASVAGQRTSAAGLGVTYGEQASFLVNFGRLGNAEGILQGFSEAETNVSKKYALRQYLGHAESGDPAKDFAEGLGRFKDFVDKTPQELLGPMLQRFGYEKLGIGIETARIIKGTSRSELMGLISGYGADLASRLGLPPDVAKKWIDFSTKIEKAGEDIDTIFWKKTAKLAKPLERLSESFINLVDNLLKDGGPISGWIKDLGKGIQTFANELGSGAVQAKAAELGKNVADIIKLFDAILAKAPQGLAVLAGMGVGARFGGAAVAIGEGLAGVAGSGAAAVGAVAGGAAIGMNKLMPQHPERLRRGQEYENAGGSPTSPHPAMTENKRQAIRDYFTKGGFGPFSHEQTSAEGQDYNIPGQSVPHFAEGGIVTKPTMAMVGEAGPEAIVPLSGFNLGNIRSKKGGWRKFETPSDAANAIVDQLARYPKMFPKQRDIDTLAGALKKYAPRGDRNDPALYARQVAKWTGIPMHEHMQLDDPEVKSKLAYGIARKEGNLHGRNIEDFRGMFIRHGAPLRRSFGHIGHHPATMGRMDRPVTVQDNTGGLVSIASH